MNEMQSNNVLATWIIEKSKIHNHSGELPLFTQGLLSVRKDEQLSGQASLQSPKPSKAGRKGQLFCRREQSHKYLMASVSNSCVNDLSIDLKPQITTYTVQFGRPTRSSLLRSAHQSASLSRTIPIQHELLSAESSPGRASRERRGLQEMPTSLGETAHSFLVGARYNRNCIDSQAFQKYGLFVSRRQPRVSFLTNSKIDGQMTNQRQEDEAVTGHQTQVKTSDNPN
ncbi:uncharacterized protein LOC108717037 isoform X2 [Xenopus laevis]|nr:uncharacterized protein LOC108717037 isoform X2 [Xenopus laevis]